MRAKASFDVWSTPTKRYAFSGAVRTSAMSMWKKPISYCLFRLELAAARLVLVGQSRDALPLQATVGRAPRQSWDRPPQRQEDVVEREVGLHPKCYDGGLLKLGEPVLRRWWVPHRSAPLVSAEFCGRARRLPAYARRRVPWGVHRALSQNWRHAPPRDAIDRPDDLTD